MAKTKKISLKVGEPLPKSLGACADALKEVTELRLEMSKDTQKIKDRENEIRNYLIENLSINDTQGVSGLRYKAEVKSEAQPTAEDWEEIYDYVVEHDRFDLMGKSLSAKAIKDMWAAGEKIPGVGTVNVKKLSLTKR